jgi:uncharacterized protein
MKILVTGGTGFLGSHLVESLLKQKHDIVFLTRKSSAGLGPQPYRIVNWPINSAEEENAILACEAVIHLAGESIAGSRWSAERKINIRRSRIQFTNELVTMLKKSTKLHTFLSASAIGYYGHRKTELLTEESHSGEGFLADVCKEWEASALELKSTARVALLRTGIVLGRDGGILKEIEPLYKNWVGGPLGAGEQIMSWIHINDWVNAVIFCLNNSKISGPVNLVSPEPVSNKSFSLVYGEMFGQPLQLPAPSAVLRVAMGEMSSIALDSQNVQPAVLIGHHFKFQFSGLQAALHDIYEFEKHGRKVHEVLMRSIWVPRPLEEVFQFFSDAQNLVKITPPEMRFNVVQKSTAEIIKGTLIDYNLSIHGVPTAWRTLISDWQPPHQFVDEQIKGPYTYWHHTHTFESLGGSGSSLRGTLMKDTVHYRLPMGALGRTFGLWLVRKDTAHIFDYRRKIILEMFA